MSEQSTGGAAPQTVSPANVSNEVFESESAQSAAPQSEAAIDSNPTLTKAEKVEAKKTLRQLKIKFNGKEITEDLPFEIPDDDASREYMTKKLQMDRLAQSKAQEYSQLEKEVKSFIEDLRKNPRKVLSDPSVGLDVKKLAAEIIEEEIQNAQKSPEQIEKEKLEAELKAMKEEREKEKDENRQREFERLQQQEFERYDMLMTQALDKHKDLPKSPYVVKKMADYMLMGLQSGQDITPEDVIPLVKQEMQEDLKEMFAVMPEDVIEALVGKDVLNRIRKKNVAKAKSAPPSPNKSIPDTGGKPKSEQSNASAKKQTFKSFFGV